jgi:hypothetical protein
MRIFLENAADRGGAQMESGSAEHLGDLLLSQRRAENLQPLHQITDQLGQFIDRLKGLHQRFSADLVDSPTPGANGLRRHQKYLGSLLQRPTADGTQLKDRHPLRGWVVRSPIW